MAELAMQTDESGMVTLYRVSDGHPSKVYPVDAREILVHAVDKDGKRLWSLDDPLKRVVGTIDPPKPNDKAPSKMTAPVAEPKIDLAKMGKDELIDFGKTLGLQLSPTLDLPSLREAITDELDSKK